MRTFRRRRAGTVLGGLLGVAVVHTPSLPTGPQPLEGQQPGAVLSPRAGPVLEAHARPQGWIGLSIEVHEVWTSGVRTVAPVMVITDVHPASPAASAGLQAGDTILRINAEVASRESLARALSSLEPGRSFAVAVQRGAGPRTVTVRSSERPRDEVLFALPTGVRVQLDSVQALILREIALLGGSSSGWAPAEGRVVMFRTMAGGQPDTGRVFVFGMGGEGTFAFERLPGGAGVHLPTPSPLEVVLERQSGQPGVVALEAARRVEETRRVEEARRVEAARAQLGPAPVPVRSTPPAGGAMRPLAPYIVGQDWIAGARLTPVNPGLAEYFGVARGLLVVDIADGTPASDAGVLPGDVIVLADGREVASVDALRELVASGRPSGPLALTLVRRGNRIQVVLPH